MQDYNLHCVRHSDEVRDANKRDKKVKSQDRKTWNGMDLGNLEEKNAFECSLSFSIAAFPFTEMEENHRLLQGSLLPHRDLNSRVSTLGFSHQGCLYFQRTKSIQSCYYLYSGSMQRKPVMVQKPLINALKIKST